MKTLKMECLNLIWINDVTDIQPILDDFKQESNFRPNITFGYMSPYEKRTEYLRKIKEPAKSMEISIGDHIEKPLLNARRIYQDGAGTERILLAIEDVTE
jgi:hypothetical protein